VLNPVAEELAALDRLSLRRRLRTVERTEGARLTVQGRSLINFSSNNYLGLARHPLVLEAVRKALDQWGAGATSSRLISGTAAIHQELESALATFMQTEAALVFPTGYMTNLGVITALVGPGDAVVMDRLCHASLVDAAHLSGARLFVYEHANPESAERALKRASGYRRRLLVTDSLFSMDGDFAPLDDLTRLAKRCDAISVLDEAHALGVWGEEGRGARFDRETGRRGDTEKRSDLPLSPRHPVPASAARDWDVVVGTLSKALGSQGGFACGSKEFVETLVNKSRSFIYTTGLSPACVACARAALGLIQGDDVPRRRVQTLARQLREGLIDLGFDILGSQSQIVPVLLGDAQRALECSAHLEACGIFAPAIRPPTVHVGQCRIRFSVTAEHTREDVNRLLEALRKFPRSQQEGEE
jgi:7-keto-8-aminopelargonate synthetase-like enzyme